MPRPPSTDPAAPAAEPPAARCLAAPRTARAAPARAALPALAALLLAACHSYEPEPVDLLAHAAAFAARLPSDAQLQGARGAPAEGHAVDAGDGIDLREARWIAICFHPDCRRARIEALGAAAARDHAATLPDPELSTDVARILETVPHPWVAAASLGFTVPWNGRLGLQRELASAQLHERELEALLVERGAADAAAVALLRWSSATARATWLGELCTRLRELAAVADRLERAGSLTRPAARAFTLELTTRELELATANDAAATGELELKQRLGLHPAAPVTFVPTAALAPRTADAAERARALPRSAAVLPAAAAHASAERELALAVRRQWPDLTIAPGWQEEDAQPRAALGLSLPLPLFAGNDAAIAKATAARAAAAEALRSALERATHDLAAAELQWTQAANRHRLVHERLLPLAQQQLDDGRRLAELGQLEPLLLLDALGRLHDARLQQLDAALAEALAAVALDASRPIDQPEPEP